MLPVRRRRLLRLLPAALLAVAGDATAAEPVEAPRSAPPAARVVVPDITRHVLIVCGHPGDDEHRTAFLKSVDAIATAFRDRWGVLPENVRILFGAEGGEHPAADRDALAAEAARLVETAKPDEAAWVVVLGHAYFDGKNAWLNLPGDDVEQAGFAEMFDGLAAREQVFLLTFPVSGFYAKPLSRPGRVIVTATEPDREINETLFPAALAETLSTPPDDFDADGDGRRTLLDLYVAVARETANRYAADKAIPTEHARLDDDGDGRGTELQLDYLPPEQGGRFKGTPPATRTAGDGVRSAEIPLP